MDNIKDIIKDSAMIFNIKYDKKRNISYGIFKEFQIVVSETTQAMVSCVNICFYAKKNDCPLSSSELSTLNLPSNVNWSVNRYRFDIIVSLRKKDTLNDIATSLRVILDSIKALGGISCDELGYTSLASLWFLQGKYSYLCEESVTSIKKNVDIDIDIEKNHSENYLFGIIGALAGAALGGLLILLIARLGYITSIGGFVLGFAAIFGYKKLAGKFSIVSVVLCTIISVAMSYFVFNLSTTIDIYPALKGTFLEGITFWECFKMNKEIMEIADSLDTYYHNLILFMISGILGPVAANWAMFKSHKEKFEMYKIV